MSIKVEFLPKMTMGRALLVAAMSCYAGPRYQMSLLDVGKIVYFLHEVGALPKLKFVKNRYGPYAESLNHCASSNGRAFHSRIW